MNGIYSKWIYHGTKIWRLPCSVIDYPAIHWEIPDLNGGWVKLGQSSFKNGWFSVAMIAGWYFEKRGFCKKTPRSTKIHVLFFDPPTDLMKTKSSDRATSLLRGWDPHLPLPACGGQQNVRVHGLFALPHHLHWERIYPTCIRVFKGGPQLAKNLYKSI